MRLPGPMFMRGLGRVGGCLAVAAAAALFASSPMGAAPGLKPPLQGLGEMGNPRFHHRDGGIPDNVGDMSSLPPGVFDVAVINATWSQLEPQAGLVRPQAIDEALEFARNYNAQNTTKPLSLRLRIWAGIDAPGWAKAIGGAPIEIYTRDRRTTVGRFWSAAYGRAWKQFQSAMAARYDAEPLIREVTMTSCATISSEPFILPIDESSIQSLHAAGMTDAAYRTCLMQAADAYTSWATTRIEYPINPFRGVDAGHLEIDTDFSLEVMKMWRQTMGERGVLSNYDLKKPLAPRIVPIYEGLRQLDGPIELQLFAPRNLDLTASVEYGISVGAKVIELWNVTVPTLSPATLEQWSARLRRN